MTRFKMLTLGALMGVAALSFASTTPVPAAQSKMTASSDCPECFPIPPTCEPDNPCSN